MMTAAGRVASRERNATNKTIALKTVKTGHNSVPATVKIKSGRIGPGTAIQIARKNTANASANGTKRSTLDFLRT